MYLNLHQTIGDNLPDLPQTCPPIIGPEYQPVYNYHHPAVQRVKLCSVKTQLYNPCLPTLQRIDMDNALSKLSDEHSQHSTTCCPGKYLTAGMAPSIGQVFVVT